MSKDTNPFEKHLFTVEERNAIYDRLLEIAHADPRIVAGAVIGSLANGPGDRWSDLDLTFGLADKTDLDAVLADWTSSMAHEFGAAHLFDLPRLTSLYRVFLLPNNLQVDLSFTPQTDFGALDPRFTLLFGKSVERTLPPKPSAQYLFGLAVHHAVRARFCIERSRFWQAEYWISGIRDEAFALACRKHGLDVDYARGFDHLPEETLALGHASLVRALDYDELLRALAGAVELLLHESYEMRDLASKLTPQLRSLTAKS